MGKAIDLTGQKFGRLTVIERDVSRKGTYWICKCDCGTITSVASQKLRNGHTKSCGCLVRETMSRIGKEGKGISRKAKDMVGFVSGRLTVIERAPNRIGPNGQVYAMWKCRCECGNEVIVWGAYLRNYHTQSCGCLVKEKAKSIGDANNTGKYDVEVGQRFGKLTAVRSIDNKNWLFRCDCGSEVIINKRNVVKGFTISCGCVKSKGEELVSSILKDNHVLFVKQHSFDSCRYKHRLSFDFYVNNNYLIEFDGEQHFKEVKYFGGKERFNTGQQRDNIKNNWCRENNIPLIRIPYWKYDTLELKDLLLETTEFRVV